MSKMFIFALPITNFCGVVKLVDTPDLGSGAERCAVRVPPPALRKEKESFSFLF